MWSPSFSGAALHGWRARFAGMHVVDLLRLEAPKADNAEPRKLQAVVARVE